MVMVLHLEMELTPEHCRAFDAESERKKIVEGFYRMNHINQTYEFVCFIKLLRYYGLASG